MADQQRLVAHAIAVSAISVGWSAVAGTTALTVAFLTGSPSLAGFGLDAIIDGAASVALISYFRIRARDPDRAERREARTTRLVGVALLAAAGYVAVRSVLELTEGVGPKQSVLGIGISAVSLLVLPPLAVVKFRLAGSLPSPALRSDGVLTVGAALLAGVALVAASLRSVGGLWWIDPAAALVIAAVLALEGVRAARTTGA